MELISGSSVALFFKILGSGATLVFSLLLARTFGAVDAGFFFLALTVAEVGTMCAGLGMAQSAIAFIGRHSARKDWAGVKGVFVTSALLMSFSSLAVGTLIFSLASFLAEKVFHEPKLAPIIQVMALSVPAAAFLNLFGNSLKALRLMRDSQFIISLCLQVLLLLFMIPVLSSPKITGVALAYGAAAWGAAGWGLLLWRRRTPYLKGAGGSFPLGKLLATALPLFWTNMLMIANARAGTFLLGMLATPHDVGVYNIAFRISNLTSFVLLAVTAICTPKFAALHASGDSQGLARVAQQSTVLMIVAAAPIMLSILIFPEPILALFGRDFANNGQTLMLLTVGQCVNIAAGPVGMLLAMTGRERLLRNVYILFTPINVLLLFALIPFFAVKGAALATTLSMIGVNLVAAYIVRREFGFTLLSLRFRRES